MKLSLNGIKDAAAWKAAGISLPSYDVEKIAADTRKAPREIWIRASPVRKPLTLT